jgi:phage tail tube protein FII
VNFLTTEVNAMGAMDVILPGLIEAMEAAITKIGIDMGLARMSTPTKHSYEFRWAQNVLKDNGKTEPEGCKAFITGVPKGIPGASIEIGSNIENEITIGVTRYQLYCGGKEILCIDRLSQICRINGTDYYKNISKLL